MISGQAALIHLDGWTWEEMAIRPSVGMAAQFPLLQVRIAPRPAGYCPRHLHRGQEALRRDNLREFQEFILSGPALSEGQVRQGAGVPERMSSWRPCCRCSKGKLPLVVTAVRERAIRDAIQFAEKEKLRLVLAQASEAGKVASELKAQEHARHPGSDALTLPLEEDDPYDAPFTLPSELYKAGVKFAFGSFGNQFARNLPYQAANAVAFGLPYEEALKAVTLYPAEIWGVADQMGSIEKGKSADLIVTDGDPLETRTQVRQMFIQGRRVDLSNKHLRLYERYRNRP